MLTSDRAHLARIIRYVAGLVVIELGLFAVARSIPAMKTLIAPAYLVVAVLFIPPIWRAAKMRSAGHDRRQADRRHDQ